MANSIESRVPFLDYPLANYIINLDLSYLNFNGFPKYCLRKKGYEEGILPENIAWRKNKIGLEPPNKLWLNNKDHYKNDLLSSEFLNQFINFEKFDWSEEKSFWKILNIYLWSNLYNVKYPNS
jgi:asparagine synthase (glutamine-hydrolysing)